MLEAATEFRGTPGTSSRRKQEHPHSLATAPLDVSSSSTLGGHCPLQSWAEGAEILTDQKKSDLLFRKEIFQGVIIFYPGICRLSTVKNTFCFPNVVGFLRVFFKRHWSIKLLCPWPPANDWNALHSLNSKHKIHILTKAMQKEHYYVKKTWMC